MTKIILDDHMDDAIEVEPHQIIKELVKLDETYLSKLTIALIIATAIRYDVPPRQIAQGFAAVANDPVTTLYAVLVELEDEE